MIGAPFSAAKISPNPLACSGTSEVADAHYNKELD